MMGTRSFRLPASIIERIFSFLPLNDVAAAESTCKTWHRLLVKTNVWKEVLLVDVRVSLECMAAVIPAVCSSFVLRVVIASLMYIAEAGSGS